jgi:hypothetical protein
LYPAWNSTSANDNQMRTASGPPPVPTSDEYKKTPEEGMPSPTRHSSSAVTSGNSATTDTRIVMGAAGAPVVRGLGYLIVPALVIAGTLAFDIY